MRKLATLQIVSAAGVLGFWIAFYTAGLAPEKAPACYLNHENSFPYADICMSVLFFFGAAGLWRRRVSGYVASIAAGGAYVFLGILDTTYNLQNGMYRLGAADAILNAFLNAYSIGFGAYVIWRCGKELAVKT